MVTSSGKLLYGKFFYGISKTVGGLRNILIYYRPSNQCDLGSNLLMNCKIFSGTFWLFVFYQEPGTDILRTKRQKRKVPLISSATVFKICKRNSSSNSQASFGLPTISRKVEIIFMVQFAFSWMRAACKLFAKTFISQPCSVCSNPYKGAQEKWADIMPLTSIRDWNFYVPFSGFFLTISFIS